MCNFTYYLAQNAFKKGCGGFFTYWDGVIETWLRYLKISEVPLTCRIFWLQKIKIFFVQMTRCLERERASETETETEYIDRIESKLSYITV
ncbi:hypothetical protein CFP56_036470 [Quercus suber]|uniref:Uncharacterized protein n=1 Tax=Quercus suber TaxID=58331 RepID=A0AAW0J7Z3_QUESU